jgi:hypothetical protein
VALQSGSATKSKKHRALALACALLVGLIAGGCAPAAPDVLPTPAGTRIVLATATHTPLPTSTPQPTLTPTLSPTASPSPSPTPLPPTGTDIPPTGTPVPPTATPTLTSPPPTQAATALPSPTRPRPAATPTTPAQAPLPPRQGGEWDMEGGFVPGVSPLGENCPGWAVAVGWSAFVAPGTPASSCLNENKNLENVHSGQRSQEITFDFISAEAGIYRQARTIPGHRYQIEAWGKHIRSQSPVQIFLGVDLAGGQAWQSAAVTWYPWTETAEDIWVHTQVTVRATGENITLFLKGYHPWAAQGGATLFDDVRLTDLGP